MHVCIIAEAGVNHNGDLNLALDLCKAAKEAGADIVKFQTWKTEKIITENVAQAKYQKENTQEEDSQFEMLKKLELGYDEFKKIKEYCEEIGIQFASTADEEESLEFLIKLGIPFIKIGSGDINNTPYLRYIGSKRMPVILSTGMSTIADVDLSIRALKEGGCNNITLLHCTTSYPCPYENVNLKAMETLDNCFGYPVGYSDHTMGQEVAVAAVARGATVIEKHFTLDRSLPGPDHIASTEPHEFSEMVKAIRNIEMALGNGKKEPTHEEQEISEVVLKRIVASKNISDGETLNINNICVKRNETGISAKYWDMIVGTKAKRAYVKDEAIEL